MSIDYSPAKDFIDGLAGTATATEWIWQAGVAATAVALAWYTARWVCRAIHPSPKWRFGAGDFERVAHPVFAFVFMAIGRLILGRYGIDLELTVWIGDPSAGEADVCSEVLLDLLRSFKAAGVEIPYPRRDVRLLATAATENIPLISST